MGNDGNLIIKQMEVGPMQNFIYFVGDKKTREVAVVDPAWDVDYICEEAEKNNYKISACFVTHGHFDHVNGLDEILSRHDVPAYVSKHEYKSFKPKHKNIVEIDGNAKIKIGDIDFDIIHTPGHSPGCQCLKCGANLVTGDTFFIGGCGRCDLPGSDVDAMYNSLYNVIMKLPDDTTIYPGHNYGKTPTALLSSEKKENHYLTCRSKEEFIKGRMGY